MNTRPLTNEDLFTLGEEIESLRNWHLATTAAREVFGDRAHRVVVRTESEYNDEGGYDDQIASVDVYDRGDEILSKGDVEPSGRFAEMLRRETAYPTSAATFLEYYADIPAIDGEYFVDRPPSLSFTNITGTPVE